MEEFYRQFKRKKGPKVFPKRNDQAISRRKGELGEVFDQIENGDCISQGEAAISCNFGTRGGIRSIFQNIGNLANEFRGTPNWDGGDDVIMGDSVDAISNDLLPIGGGPGKEGRFQMAKYRGESERTQEEKNILISLALIWGCGNCEPVPFKIESK